MMEFTEFQRSAAFFLSEIELKMNEPMSKHTSFRIGGNAEVMAFPKNTDELRKIMLVSGLLDFKPSILGAGTNVLAPDQGISGLVVCLKDCMDGMEVLSGHRIRVSAGVTMTRAAVFAANNGLSGLEFAHGIPGTVGGGVYMNAGAYGGEISQVCEVVTVMDPYGDLEMIPCNKLGFSYRHSVLQEGNDTVVSVVFQLTPGEPEEIRGKMKELQAKRSASQPLDLPSAGSAFKRPVGGYAAALIDQAGLKGFSVGGAAISTKHAGFAVNLGGATAEDVKNLLSQVSDLVYDQSGIRLEPEVRIW